jgi:hypothetical protein
MYEQTRDEMLWYAEWLDSQAARKSPGPQPDDYAVVMKNRGIDISVFYGDEDGAFSDFGE